MVRFQVCRIQRSSGTFLTVSKADGGERPEEVKLPAAAHRYATEGGICDSKLSARNIESQCKKVRLLTAQCFRPMFRVPSATCSNCFLENP